MRDVSHCPICQDPLHNYFSERDRSWRKMCNTKLDHRLYFAINEHSQNIRELNLMIGRGAETTINWFFEDRELAIIPEDGSLRWEELPFFEPDFSNFSKLKNKIRTLLNFV